jgi:hypothetical protein
VQLRYKFLVGGKAVKKQTPKWLKTKMQVAFATWPKVTVFYVAGQQDYPRTDIYSNPIWKVSRRSPNPRPRARK